MGGAVEPPLKNSLVNIYLINSSTTYKHLSRGDLAVLRRWEAQDSPQQRHTPDTITGCGETTGRSASVGPKGILDTLH